MAGKRPPRGYSLLQYPLPHNFIYNASLRGEDETRNSWIATILRTSEVATGVEDVEVNPRHANFVEDVGPLVHIGSIVPRMSIRINMALSKLAIETDKIRSCIVKWMPIYTSFLSSLEAMDSKTGVQVEDILELQHDTTNKDVYPIFSTVNLDDGGQALSTVPATEVFGDYGLTGDAVNESVAFNEALFWDAKQYYTNHGMLNKVTGRMNTVILKQDHPYRYFSNNFTNPTVKRGNEYTFCGILFHLPQGSFSDQLFTSGDTTDIKHVNIGIQVRYDEWNPLFEQAQI